MRTMLSASSELTDCLESIQLKSTTCGEDICDLTSVRGLREHGSHRVCESEGHLQEAADIEAHELPQDGQQQLMLAIDNVDTANVHQRQRQRSPSYANNLCGVVVLGCRGNDWLDFPCNRSLRSCQVACLV